MQKEPLQLITTILPCFFSSFSLASVSRLGEGNINDTYLVMLADRAPVVLQRINSHVFPKPTRVADNVRLVTEHIGRQRQGTEPQRRTVSVIPTLSGSSYSIDSQGQTWRMVDYITNTECFSSVRSERQAYHGGALLGWFHHQLRDLDGELLQDPLPGFHDLPGYFRLYQQAVSSHRRKPSAELHYCCRQAEKRSVDADLLSRALISGHIRKRIIHGDPKIANILFDKDSGEAVALIDLDTVSMGALQFDIGDCLRSYCNAAGEDPTDPDTVVFDLDICRAVLQGYCSSGADLPPSERNLVYQGTRLLTYELALRFLTDYLEEDRYFKVSDGEENLRRARAQFRLLKSVESHRWTIEKMAEQL